MVAGRKLLISGGTIRGPGGRRGVAGDHCCCRPSCSWERKCGRRRERETHTHTKLSLRERERERDGEGPLESGWRSFGESNLQRGQRSAQSCKWIIITGFLHHTASDTHPTDRKQKKSQKRKVTTTTTLKHHLIFSFWHQLTNFLPSYY